MHLCSPRRSLWVLRPLSFELRLQVCRRCRWSPDAVLGRLERAIDELQAGTVAVKRLVERNRVSKPLEGYSQNTQNVAALERARDQDLAAHPSQDIEYVIVNDEKPS